MILFKLVPRNLDSRMPTRTHPDWDTDATYVRNIQSVESTGSTGYKDAHFMPGEMFFCGVVTEACLGPLGNYKKDEYVSKVTNAYHSVTVAVHELESTNSEIRSAERSLGSLLNLEDTLRPLTSEQGTLRVRSKVVRKSRAGKVQKLEDVVVPRGYKLQPCFTTLGLDGSSQKKFKNKERARRWSLVPSHLGMWCRCV